MDTVNEIFLKGDKQLIRIDCKEIIYIKAADNFVKVFTVSQKEPHLVLFSLTETERILPANYFIRIHRSIIVGKKYIRTITSDTVEIEAEFDPAVKVKPEERQIKEELALSKKYISALKASSLILGDF